MLARPTAAHELATLVSATPADFTTLVCKARRRSTRSSAAADFSLDHFVPVTDLEREIAGFLRVLHAEPDDLLEADEDLPPRLRDLYALAKDFRSDVHYHLFEDLREVHHRICTAFL